MVFVLDQRKRLLPQSQAHLVIYTCIAIANAETETQERCRGYAHAGYDTRPTDNRDPCTLDLIVQYSLLYVPHFFVSNFRTRTNDAKKNSGPNAGRFKCTNAKILSLHAVDIRPDIFALFNDILGLIDTFCADTTQVQAQVPSAYTHVQSVKHYLALEVVRERTSLYPTSTNSSQSWLECDAANNSRAVQRVMKLAQNDSFWYLCNILHLMFSTPAPCNLPPNPSQTLLMLVILRSSSFYEMCAGSYNVREFVAIVDGDADRYR